MLRAAHHRQPCREPIRHTLRTVRRRPGVRWVERVKRVADAGRLVGAVEVPGQGVENVEYVRPDLRVVDHPVGADGVSGYGTVGARFFDEVGTDVAKDGAQRRVGVDGACGGGDVDPRCVLSIQLTASDGPVEEVLE